MKDVILTLNAGSSSVKFCLFAQEKDLPLLGQGEVAELGATPSFAASRDGAGKTTQKLPAGTTSEDALRVILDWINAEAKDCHIVATAHRIVHGGSEFTQATRITPDVVRRLERLCPLAPLHQPHNLAAINIVEKLLPQSAQIGCFDTAFHAQRDPLFTSYAVPQELADKNIRRYGFHGLSYEWIAYVLRHDHPALAKGRVIAAHLGAGASLCAMKDGRSVDTTMGMTALDGLPMATRSGALDPGALIYMIRDLGLSPSEVEHMLYEKSGLKGLSGLTGDMKTLLTHNDPKAKFAVDYYTLRIAQFMAAMATAIGGVDAIVFTGGIGENAPSIRNDVMERLAFMGDPRILTIPPNEERIMAMQTAELLS